MILAAIAVSSAARANAATPGDRCTPEQRKGVDAYYAAVRVAAGTPGDPMYVPYPFPTSDVRIIADVVYQLRDILGRDAKLPASQKRVLAGISNQTLRYTVTRVEDWTDQACGSIFPAEWDYQIELFDVNLAQKIAVAVVSNTGMFEGAQYAKPGQTAPTLAGLSAAARRRVDLVKPETARYIRAEGTVRCDMFFPCVALDGASMDATVIYVPTEQAFYSLAHGQPLLSAATELNSAEGLSALRAKLGPRERVITVDPTSLAVLERIELQ
ncbi:MAG: hypothetical protein ABI609_15865 [Acidobacteriota bacterium]